MRSVLLATLCLAGCRPDAPPVPPVVTEAPATRAPAPPAPPVNWWSAPPKKFTGKNGSVTFTIDAPSSLEQQVGISYRFQADGVQLTVGSMVAWAQRPQTLGEYKATLAPGDPIAKETGSELTWALLIEDHITPDLVTAIFATPANGQQSRCVWEVPRTALKGDTVDGWDVMERTCRSLAFD